MASPTRWTWVWAFQTTQGNRLSCRDQEGRRGSEEAVPGPSVFPSGDPGVSGDFWAQLMSVESVMPSNHLIPCHPLLLLPSIFPSIRVFTQQLKGMK